MITQSWREKIAEAFTSQYAQLTLVADPDGLVREEGILEALSKKGFEILPFDDAITFRYAYESLYRTRWDNGETIELIVLVTEGPEGLKSLPYDILQRGRTLSFSLSDLFPNLQYQVVRTLDRSDLDVLYQAQCTYHPAPMGEHATKDFILKHVFDIETEQIRKPTDLLHILLRRLYSNQPLPASLEQRLIQSLRQNVLFQDWPLEQIIPQKEILLQFLQERWPIFLDHAANPKKYIREQSSTLSLTYPGPLLLPFQQDDVRVYIDTLFLDEMLQPVELPPQQAQIFLTGKRWEMVGIQNTREKGQFQRLERLLKTIERDLPTGNIRHQDWQNLMPRWAELLVRWHERQTQSSPELENRFLTVRTRIDATFQDWVIQRYHTLYNLPPIAPIMLHHIPHILAHLIQTCPTDKIALIIIDGMAFDQWIVLREVLTQQRDVNWHEETVFAWVPTITSVSRQAIFAGKPPFYYADSIHTTQKEEVHWHQFWLDRGLSKTEVVYKKGIRTDEHLIDLEVLTSHPKRRVAGLVVDTIDRITHGMRLGAAGMHDQVRQWAEKGFFARLLDLLYRNHYTVYVTSDHGNIEASGCGRPMEGAIAEYRGERVRIYTDPVLREKVKNQYPASLVWTSLGLPKNYHPLFAPSREAFVGKGGTIVCHGGITMEELLIPFIRIRSSTHE